MFQSLLFLKIKSFIPLIMIFLTFQAISMESDTIEIDINPASIIRNDPPFYRISVPGRIKPIYILGSIHPLPLNLALTGSAYQQLETIVKGSPKFFIEHKGGGEKYLEYISKEKMHSTWEEDRYIKGKIDTIYLQELNSPENHNININIDLDRSINISPVHFSDLKTLNPWLAAPILDVHVGTLYRKKFGGFEYDIRSKWRNYLPHEEYLEEFDDLIKLMQESSGKNYDNDLYCIQQSLILLRQIKLYDNSDNAKGYIKRIYTNHINNYTFWDHNNSEKADAGTILRNKLWVDKLEKLNFLDSDHDKDILIVVGADHLKGPENFMHLLLHYIKTYALSKNADVNQIKVSRFSNDNSWKDFDFN